MSVFNNLLKEITNKLNSSQLNKKDISDIISDIINFKLKPDQLDIKNNTVYLNVSPTIKSVIVLKRDLILESLKKFNIKTIA